MATLEERVYLTGLSYYADTTGTGDGATTSSP